MRVPVELAQVQTVENNVESLR